jgi:hypothetical protein
MVGAGLSRNKLIHYLTYINVGAIFLAKPVDVQVTEKGKGNMRFVYLAILIIILLIACGFLFGCTAPEEVTTEEEYHTIKEVTEESYNQIISLILSQVQNNAQHNYVNPEMSFSYGHHDSQYIINGFASTPNTRNSIEALFAESGYEFSALIELHQERNQTPTQMEIPSSPGNGYIIDYDGEFHAYLFDNGWESTRREFPGTYGYVSISNPAYDPETGVVIVYIELGLGPTTGTGDVCIFHYKDDELTRVACLQLLIA